MTPKQIAEAIEVELIESNWPTANVPPVDLLERVVAKLNLTAAPPKVEEYPRAYRRDNELDEGFWWLLVFQSPQQRVRAIEYDRHNKPSGYVGSYYEEEDAWLPNSPWTRTPVPGVEGTVTR